jgi:hypothetical protein
VLAPTPRRLPLGVRDVDRIDQSNPIHSRLDRSLKPPHFDSASFNRFCAAERRSSERPGKATREASASRRPHAD